MYANVEQYGVRITAERTVYVLHPFYSRSFVVAAGSPLRVAIALNPAYSVEVWTTRGKLERIVRRSHGRRAPTEVEKAGVREFWSRYGDPSVSLERLLSEVPQPDSLPAIVGLAIGPAGELLVQRDGFLTTDSSSLFDVFDSSGRWAGEWRLPPRIIRVAMGSDYILISRLDQNDVPRIEVYRFRRE